jgi:signal transduction histidine kinase
VSGLAWCIAGGALVVVAVAFVAELSGHQFGVAAEIRDWVLALLCAPLGARVATHAPRNPIGWLVLAVGAFAAATVGTSLWAGSPASWFRDWLWWPSFGLLLLVALLFPDGRPVSRRWRWLTVELALGTAVGTIALAAIAARAHRGLVTGGAAPVRPGWDTAALLAAYACLLVGAVLTVIALAIRIRRTSGPARGPMLLAGANAALLLITFVLDLVEGVPGVWIGGTLAIPVATAIGVLRYGLYDIDLLVHRSLLYGLLTVAVIAVYSGAVALAARVVPPVEGVVAAAVTVVVLLPLREGVHALLERALYGQRSRPYELVTTLNRRIGLAHTPEEVLGSAVTAVGEGLKAPFVAVHLGDREVAEATHGRRRPWPVTTMALTHRGQEIGTLLVQQRGPDEPWPRRERALLHDLSEQLGPSAASVRLTRDLQAARERLVRAREEELRRLQRDLHDGIGPALTGARMLARAARTDGDSAARILTELEGDLADATVELRRIIDNLRPPALDRGLAAALDTVMRRHRSAGLDITLSVTGDLRDVPAAVEVATYRVIDEALTNVAKHANGARAEVVIARDADQLRVDVDDDGIGPTTAGSDGVGLESMRQRCLELGGQLEVRPRSPGTRIAATIPLG